VRSAGQQVRGVGVQCVCGRLPTPGVDRLGQRQDPRLGQHGAGPGQQRLDQGAEPEGRQRVQCLRGRSVHRALPPELGGQQVHGPAAPEVGEDPQQFGGLRDRPGGAGREQPVALVGHAPPGQRAGDRVHLVRRAPGRAAEQEVGLLMGPCGTQCDQPFDRLGRCLVADGRGGLYRKLWQHHGGPFPGPVHTRSGL
jgi:hypothetical protein